MFWNLIGFEPTCFARYLEIKADNPPSNFTFKLKEDSGVFAPSQPTHKWRFKGGRASVNGGLPWTMTGPRHKAISFLTLLEMTTITIPQTCIEQVADCLSGYMHKRWPNYFCMGSATSFAGGGGHTFFKIRTTKLTNERQAFYACADAAAWIHASAIVHEPYCPNSYGYPSPQGPFAVITQYTHFSSVLIAQRYLNLEYMPTLFSSVLNDTAVCQDLQRQATCCFATYPYSTPISFSYSNVKLHNVMVSFKKRRLLATR
jgi:hypothetical protein